jgi:hypothetical protein
MREKLDILLEKYYKGNTSLAEEKVLRELLSQTSGYDNEKQFFSGLAAMKRRKPSKKLFPKAKGEIYPWLKVAAVMVLFLGMMWIFVDQQSKKEEALAYAQVMEAFSLIQEHMEKGAESLEVLQDMKHLNKTNELFNINQKEEK